MHLFRAIAKWWLEISTKSDHARMEQPQPFLEKQRAAFARLVEEAKKRKASALESESDVDERVKSELLRKLAKGCGASPLVAKIRRLREKLETAEKALGRLGFECDEDSISLKWDAPKGLQAKLAEVRNATRMAREEALKKYDRAILDIWAAEKTEVAKKIVEGLL